MIRINQLKLPVEHKPEELKKKAAKALRISPEQVEKLEIRRRSLDGRKKHLLSGLWKYVWFFLADCSLRILCPM